MLFTAGGSDQTTHPLCGFTFRTEAALCQRRGRLHARIHARHRLVKDMSHESVVSGVFAGKVLENNTEGVREGVLHLEDYATVFPYFLFWLSFQGRLFGFRRTMKSEVLKLNTKDFAALLPW